MGSMAAFSINSTIRNLMTLCIVSTCLCSHASDIDIKPRTHYDVEIAPWPTWYGPYGNRSAPSQNLILVDDLNKARLVWTSQAIVPSGSPVVPRRSTDNSDHSWSGGYCAPILAEGKLYMCYWRPAERKDWQWTSEDDKYKFDRAGRNPVDKRPSTAADDIIICIDMKTGKTVWEQNFRGKGIMAAGYKTGTHPVVCYYDGKVYATGTSGLLYAVDAATGKPLWEAKTGIYDAIATAKQSNEPIPGKRPILTGSIVAGDGVVALSQGTVEAFDAATGERTWKSSKRIATGQRCMGNIWVHSGKSYFFFKGTLIETRSGRQCWSLDEEFDVDPQHSAFSGDLLIVQTVMEGRDKERPTLRCYHITPTKYKLLWEADNGPKEYPAQRSDMFIYEGRVYKVFHGRLSGRDPGGSTRCYDLLSGKLLGQNPDKAGVWQNLWGYHGIAADGRFICTGFGLKMLNLDPDDLEYLNSRDKPMNSVNLPEFTPHAYSDGFIYLRALEGAECRIRCYDIRARR